MRGRWKDPPLRLQRQRGAVGQTGGIKVALRLGQIDADAAQNAPALLLVAVAHALAQDAHDLLPLSRRSLGHLIWQSTP